MLVKPNRFLYGVDYYPEHWDRKLWARDVKLMKRAGFNIVRLAEFAWCFLEPREGVFEFDWLDDALAVLDKAGIAAILGTPTAAVPAWMAQKYPGVMAMDLAGRRKRFGMRKDYCVTDPDFGRLAMRIVEQLARRYGRDRRVVGFQTDNEFNASVCRCPLCRKEFHAFLRRKYRTVERLNRAWGTRFWGAVYDSFEQIDWPVDIPNPSLGLDAKRFFSWVDVNHQARQIALLRRFAPAKRITHNFMGLFSDLDYHALAAGLDFAAWDNYPGVMGELIGQEALAHTVTWSLKNANFLVMEQQSGSGGWEAFRADTAPGETALLAWQSIARGADGIVFFRWRTSLSGQEQYWHGIINHDNVPRRRYHEVAAMGRAVGRVGRHILGTEPAAEVGIYNNYEQIWATAIQPQNREDPVLFKAVMVDLAAAMADLAADFGVFKDGDDLHLARFKLLLCPPLYLSDPRLVAQLTRFVRSGGRLVLAARSGVKDLTNLNLMRPLPGPFARLAGVEVAEYDIVRKSVDWQVELSGAGRIAAKRIRELLDPRRGTEVLAVHRGGAMDGRPAVTRHPFGKGCVWYVGTLPTAAGWQTLLGPVLADAGVEFRTDLPAGVEIARRRGRGRTLTFVMNHTAAPASVEMPGAAKDLLTGRRVEGRVDLAAFQTVILESRR